MKISINVNSDLQIGLKRLAKLLKIEFGEGVKVNAICGDRIGAAFKNGEGFIYYKEKHHFFRELGVFVENAKEGKDFDISEDGFFKTVGLMFNATFSSPKVRKFCEYIDYMALLGYNLVMLYTEDNFNLEGREYFGYMHHRYTEEDLKALDDYAYEYGIEMIPCLECYGHMQNYLYWDEAVDVKDTPTVLLAREEKTFELMEELIVTASRPFRSNRVHIGMDEAWNMGRGRFLDKNGFVPPFEIFKEYMQRLVEITDKHSLRPMMWSDMYMRISSKTHWPYDKDIVVSEELKASVPEGVELVFWHYGEDPGCDEYMLEKHNMLNRNVIMATGLWDWSTKLPDNIYAYETTKFSLESCRKTNVRDMMTTKWGGGNLWITLLGLTFTAELCYNPKADEKTVKERFDFISEGSYDAFAVMSQFNNIFDEEHKYEDYSTRFLGHALFWQDILEGTYDTHLFDRPMSAHYRKCADSLRAYNGKFKDTVENARLIFEFMSNKTEISEKIWRAYQNGDRDTLVYIKDKLIPLHIENTERLWELERRCYIESFSQAYQSYADRNYGGEIMRARSAAMLLDDYLAGRISSIDALAEKRLLRKVNGFLPYRTIVQHTP